MVAMAAPLDQVDWPLRTERLSIRPATEADTESVWSFRRLDEVSRWITQAPQSLEEFAGYFVQPERLAQTLVVELDGQVLGDLYLHVQDGWAQAEVAEQGKDVEAEIGWTLHPSYGGQGYATEAVRALIELCFGHLGIRRIVANCFADNTPSWELMERLGMRREAHAVRDSLHRERGWLDGMTYAVLADEWGS